MMTKNKTFFVRDNDTIKFQYDGEQYCVHIRSDDTPFDPRRDEENITIMACWHRRYNLGDDLPYKDPESFWQQLVKEIVSNDKVTEMAKDGKLDGIRIRQNKDNPELVDVYESAWDGHEDDCNELVCEGIRPDAIFEYIETDLSVTNCMRLMQPYAEWLPLWLYDHGGITMSCGNRTGVYADRWDSGCVGWIILLKENAFGELCYFDEDENGLPVNVRPLTEDTWRARAVEVMEADVERYDQYLMGQAYGYTLYRQDGEEWAEEETIWGFLGSDILENGIADEVSGLREAIESGDYEIGEATLHTVSYFKF